MVVHVGDAGRVAGMITGRGEPRSTRPDGSVCGETLPACAEALPSRAATF